MLCRMASMAAMRQGSRQEVSQGYVMNGRRRNLMHRLSFLFFFESDASAVQPSANAARNLAYIRRASKAHQQSGP